MKKDEYYTVEELISFGTQLAPNAPNSDALKRAIELLEQAYKTASHPLTCATWLTKTGPCTCWIGQANVVLIELGVITRPL